MLITKDLRLELLEALDRQTKGCKIQAPDHDGGWTCGTCFFAIDEDFDNQDWQTILAVRGDTDSSELDNLPSDVKARVKQIIKQCNDQ